MPLPILGLGKIVLGFLGGPITELIKRYVPDKNKQKEFDQEFRMTVLDSAISNSKAFADRLLAEIQHPNWLRDSVRPIITYFAFGVYAYGKVTTIYICTSVYVPLMQEMLKGTPKEVYGRLPHIKPLLVEFQKAIFTEFDFYVLLTILSFWFGSKLLERFTEKVTGAGGIRALVFGADSPKIDSSKLP